VLPPPITLRHACGPLVRCLVLLLAVSCGDASQGTHTARPDVLLLLTDQQAASAMSAHGELPLATPHMDGLAARGVRFTRSYCTAPLCSPARASLITARMPHETGVERNGQAVPARFPNLGTRFREAGYRTVWVGKWHLPSPYPSGPGGLAGREVAGFDYVPVDASRDKRRGSAVDAEVARLAMAELQRDDPRPLLLVVSLLNPHDIALDAREALPALDDDASLPALPEGFAAPVDEPAFLARIRADRGERLEQHGGDSAWDARRWRLYLRDYYALVEQVDTQIGRVLSALDDSPRRASTLVALTSDHGNGLARNAWALKGGWLDDVIGVPFVLAWPGVLPEGRVDSTHIVSGVDLAPTLLDYAGLPPGSGGRSLRACLTDPRVVGREHAVVELRTRFDDRARVLRSHDFKYVLTTPIDGAREELLYDLRVDPLEHHDLVSDPRYADELARHRAWLRAWALETHDTLLPL